MTGNTVTPFATRMRIGLDDVDHVQVLYYPRIAHFCCLALEEFFRVGLERPWPEMLGEHRLAMPTVDLQVTYRRPLRFGDEIEVTVGVKELGNRKATFVYEIKNLATGERTHTSTQTVVFVDGHTWRAVPIPASYRSALEAFVV